MHRRPQGVARRPRRKVRVARAVLKTAFPFRLVLVTAGSYENASFISENLTNSKLAACVTILPNARSIYRWKGKVEQADEFLLLIKTRKSHLKKIHQVVRVLHTYEVPEFLTLELSQGDSAYLSWLGAETE